MIPRHRPPLGVVRLLATAAQGVFQRATLSRIEARYSELLNSAHVVWIPSARFGITHAIRSHPDRISTVCSSAFNCGAVFHAVRETQCDIRYVDVAAESFLMDTHSTPSPASAVVLSEMFGQRFSDSSLQGPLAADADLRIFDMAMCIPEASDLERMQDHDVTVLSFGLGKSLYAGWGGLAISKSPEMAERLTAARDQRIRQPGRMASLKWDAKVVVRTVAHQPNLYGPLRKRKSDHGDAVRATFASQAFSSTSHEWQRGISSLHCALALKNADMAPVWADRRRKIARCYRDRLRDHVSPDLLPPSSNDAGSHFCLRVPAERRDSIRQQLWRDGVDVGTLFPTPTDLCPTASFPNAAAASAEILNIPLSNQLSDASVQHIAKCLKAVLCDAATENPSRIAA